MEKAPYCQCTSSRDNNIVSVLLAILALEKGFRHGKLWKLEIVCYSRRTVGVACLSTFVNREISQLLRGRMRRNIIGFLI